jgi:Tfp pilus assembly protein PilV
VFAFMQKQPLGSIRPRAALLDRAPLFGRSDAGFTIIEVLVSALITVLIASATAAALIAGTHFSGDQRSRSQADALAQQDQERLKGLSDEQLSGINQTRTVAYPNGNSFTVTSAASFLDSTGASSCTSTGVAYYKINSTVSWTENYTSRPATVTDESLLSRPVGGDLLTGVTDPTLTSLQGVTVTASGPSTQSGSTDANGCIVFAGLTPGPYIVTLADPNYVDANGNASPPNMTATVTAAGSASPSGGPTFHLGLAGTVGGSFTTAMTDVTGEADTISWLGSGASLGMAGYRSSTPLSVPAGAITIGSLFPFDVTAALPAGYTNNYSVWAGRCLQNEPPSGIDQFTVSPGSNQAQNVQEAPLDVAAVYYNNGTTPVAVKPAHVRLTYTSTAGASCTAYSWYPTVTTFTTEPSTGWLAYPGQPFATTVTSGTAASAASAVSPQTGTLSMCVDYYDSSVNTYYNRTTTGFTNASFTSLNVAPTITITRSSSGRC